MNRSGGGGGQISAAPLPEDRRLTSFQIAAG
nr:MAG TPA: hypothetical protein [Caudoviricetes sp.]